MSAVSRTCQSCAKSKVRCIRSADNPHVCTRCLRSGKQCLYRQSGRRFHGFEKDRKIEALESRVKELMTDRSCYREPSGSYSDTALSTGSGSIPDENLGSDLADQDVIERGCLSLDMADHYLNTFKTVLTPHFPFVIVPAVVSAAELRQEKPFLFLAILASASYDNMPLQRLLGAEVKKTISTRMIVNREISFDLLQGLLVYLAWSHYHTKPHRYTQFLQLAVSLIIEMRLDRPPQTKTWKTALRFAPKWSLNEQTYSRPSWGNSEKRAVIGCYYLSSSISILVQKHSTFPYVSYIEECCQSLHDANEFPHDKHMIHLIQLQHLAEKIDRLSASHGSDLMKPGSGSELYVTNLKADLEGFYRRLPFDMYEMPFLAIHFFTTGLCLYQIAVDMTGPQPSPSVRSYQSWRDEMCYAALNATESILNLYLLLPANTEMGFTNTQWVQMAFAMLVSSRYTATTAKPEQQASLLNTVAQLEQRLNTLATAQVDMNGDPDAFVGFRKRVVDIRRKLEGKHHATTTPPPDAHFQPSTEPDIVSFTGATLQYGSAGLIPLPQEYWFPGMDGGLPSPDGYMVNMPNVTMGGGGGSSSSGWF